MVCANLALHWGWRGFGIVNLKPWIDSNPHNSVIVPPSIKTKNDNWIIRSHKCSDFFVLAVGSQEDALMKSEIRRLKLKEPFYSIGERNTDGSLPHPQAPIFKNKDKYLDSPLRVDLGGEL
jgi:hypothetical protein